ncbi:hypothetical protein SEEH4316_18344 [Salmonella enterica subsp. enterica serovar Heidelberg str. RI-11-014316]|nr:hypothetical protein SEEH4316_18344 [Salmonella enterica subsp. enterica serovar Heidelberg str. RI-11-014316]
MGADTVLLGRAYLYALATAGKGGGRQLAGPDTKKR